MTTILLVRHAHCDGIGSRLAGRMGGVHLSENGRDAAECLARRLAALPVSAVFSSPVERAIETARAIADAHGLVPHVLQDFTELDYGDWTGCTVEQLSGTRAWVLYHRNRATGRIPGGERLCDAQQRALSGLREVHAMHDNALVAVVTHADIIRAIVAGVLGLSLDAIDRFEVSPASVSVVEFSPEWSRVVQLNLTSAGLPVVA